MENDIEMLITGASGGEVLFRRNERGNVVCVLKTGARSYEEEGKTVHEALVSARTKAQRDANLAANPHLQP